MLPWNKSPNEVNKIYQDNGKYVYKIKISVGWSNSRVGRNFVLIVVNRSSIPDILIGCPITAKSNF